MPVGEPPTLDFCTWPVTGSKRATVPVESAIQTLPAPVVTAAGELPTGTTRDTLLVRGSTSMRRPGSVPATQIPRSLAARPAGAPPRAMVARTWPLRGSILDSALSVTLVTQTDP